MAVVRQISYPTNWEPTMLARKKKSGDNLPTLGEATHRPLKDLN
jgi:hypothetical protein